MAINKNASKIKKFFELLFAGTVFVVAVFVKILIVVSIISSHVITESSMLPTYIHFHIYM